MYALSVSAERDYYRCVPPDPGIATAALGASESGTLPGTAPAEALHTFTLDSGASRCLFRQVAANCSCHHLSHQTLLWHHHLGHPSLPCLRGMHSHLLRAAPHSSSFPPTTAPLQTLLMDVWGPARVSGKGRERYFMLVVDDYTRYTMVFPLRSKGKVIDVLIPWIRTDFCRGEGILLSFTLLDSPQQNGIAKRRIGLIMEVARTSMIHAAAPHFLWSFA
ncbi:unnamed protein product, partial [Closterium sp. NIES-54]